MTRELPQVAWPDNPETSEPRDGIPVPIPRANSHARICANCLSLVHIWSVPQTEDIELPVLHDRYGLTLWRCLCHCGCPAVMATTGPALGPEPRRFQGGDSVGI
jgi:hypothetical protein